MYKQTPITQEKLQDILEYDKYTGIFRWKISSANRIKIGDIAGTLHKYSQYVNIMLPNKNGIFKAHRLAWYYCYGINPKTQIDHINGIRNDNRIENLREATNQQNSYNRGINSRNKTGYTGVYFSGTSYIAQIKLGENKIHIGSFATAK